MKIRILFKLAWFLSLLAFSFSQDYTKMPQCSPTRVTNPRFKKAEFVYLIDRSAYWRPYERYLYVLKQLTCMIPVNDLFRFIILDYSHHSQYDSYDLKSNEVDERTYSQGWDMDQTHFDYCPRFKAALKYEITRLYNNLRSRPVENVHFIVPIYADSSDKDDCSMVRIFNETFKDFTEREELHFNGILINGGLNHGDIGDPNIFLDITNIGIIDPREKSMVTPRTSDYVRKVEQIVISLQQLIDETILKPVELLDADNSTTDANIDTTTPIENLPDDEQGREEIMTLIIMILGALGAIMIIVCLCCWFFMWKSSADKKKESKLRSASRDRATPSTEPTGTPSKERRSTPPRVSLSGVDSIDELYIEPSTEPVSRTPLSGTPLSRTPLSRTPQSKTPQRPSYEGFGTPQRNYDGF